MTAMDKKAYKILKDYDLLDPADTDIEDFSYAKQHNMMFDNVFQTHDKCADELFAELKKIAKTKITNAFLYSLSSNNLNYRAGLSVYAIMQTFPDHKYEGFRENSNVCKFCASLAEEEADLNFFNQCRHFTGGIVSKDIYEFTFFLKQANLLDDVAPTKTDFDIFSDIMKIICCSGEKATPNILQKQIKSIANFKSDEEQRRSLLETLGYCSILENSKHKGFLTNYTVLELAPQKKHSSDWSYPADWWTGSDGVNKNAYDFWFGNYPELALSKI